MMNHSHLIKEHSHATVEESHRDRYENRHESSLYLENQPVCPCCSYTLLRHISLHGVYWYCSHCHQKMPPGQN